mmetsp:Transcript_98131/g.282104  ORF Transcript_98131/g.282104 Transcript_98131/m.282104 type:complete len:337 (+) Transcript_98131:112-1122(+)|eukprot:CAMPEP_0177178536 /NCGR_PEP_ID=MMETSP0367-20130122/14379_1 /TAXON_ID=447022 ORGANISM="Scrippsiella hangoei-like, Strain SHHI-4" /NCGR_SAMPLE_ID=MMETSP0367 /ASSEMBLY_ACC=CAM_ASM_000362 /LENGTH=336 /DNA_ID=CAMNT_0018625197 /DNA_START=100 /DNA_END=1110 /DNA_ORIENTATION=+
MAVVGKEDAKVRNLRKKLAQISLLEDKAAEGVELSPEQSEKVERKEELELELGQLLDGDLDRADSATTTAASDEQPLVTISEASPLSSQPPSDSELGVPEDGLRGGAGAGGDGDEVEAEVPPTRPRLPSNRWEDDPLAVEDVAPASEAKNSKAVESEILEAVQPFAPATQADSYLRRLIRATSDLSKEAFESDVLDGVSRKGKWKLTLLSLPRGSFPDDDPWGGLLGFIAYKLKPAVQCVSIAKLAVVPEHRGKGHGHKLVQWCIAMAKKQQNIIYLSLTSLPQAVRFYKQIGFRPVDVDLTKLDPGGIEDDYDYVAGQVYMEYRCKGRAGGKRHR